MKTRFILLISSLFLFTCRHQRITETITYHGVHCPDQVPESFKPELTPDQHLIHRGLFSPDGLAYYFTISDSIFQQFTVKLIRWEGDKWSYPQPAFFNSEYNEHGMSFSADGQELYFSSTRPITGKKETSWQLWYSKKVKDVWQKPTWIHIPEFEEKVVSHPSIARSGTLYFHAANQDYSEMALYRVRQKNGSFLKPERLGLNFSEDIMLCTPFVDPDERYLIFALVVNELELMISCKDDQEQWATPQKLPARINQFGQGNPTVTSDGRYLLFTVGGRNKPWEVKWVATEGIIPLPLK